MLELHDEETFHTDARTLSRYLKPDLLILDDMGIKQLPPQPSFREKSRLDIPPFRVVKRLS